MLKEAHLALEKTSALAQAVKAERWQDARAALYELQAMLLQLDRDLAAAEADATRRRERDEGQR